MSRTLLDIVMKLTSKQYKKRIKDRYRDIHGLITMC